MAEPARMVSHVMDGLLNPARLLVDLQRANELARNLSGCMEPEAIARRITEGLIAQFDCAFARIWLVEPDGASLRLVASSGMYTRLDGEFARVPMGAYKVGKIAQNQVPFLSNNLSEESWVKDRDWAIANEIRGFAGYPLMAGDRVVGVIAMFSHRPLATEFLEVLQSLCTTIAVALEAAIRFQQQVRSHSVIASSASIPGGLLSDQLAAILTSTRLTLVGTEKPLPLSTLHLFLAVAERLNQLDCIYSRLTYRTELVSLETIVAVTATTAAETGDWVRSLFGDLSFTVSCLGGSLKTVTDGNETALQIVLNLPYPTCSVGPKLKMLCTLPVLQSALTQLAYQAGIWVCNDDAIPAPLLTNDVTQVKPGQSIIWLDMGLRAIPKGVAAVVDLAIAPAQLREAVEAVSQGQTWGLSEDGPSPVLSEREQEIMQLLSTGLRDRDIANTLMISESTIKFHVNNVLSKLKARTRYQALSMAIANGWIATS
ncbi:GAF domain-containing protein [Leptolyngbya sp. AN02str]|uniref:GAF domain-containing protein n=1 Tax=Leptolyngbya sp. AN02str TaxID=3423363 RepID=UPI003D31C0D1